jgi:predicted Rossmann fold flavoprotein
VIGGGAAGLMTAIMAARGGARVHVLDGASRLGAKILISGGGRCNVTNRRVTAADFCGGSRSTIARVLNAWTVDDTVRFFAEAGVPLHEEVRGKLFPDADSARVVLEALLDQAAASGVVIEPGWRVDHVEDDGERFAVAGERGTLTCARIVLATGGRSVPKTGSTGAGYAFAQALGHTLVEPIPALVPLLLDDGLHQQLAGVTVDVEIAVVIDGRVSVRTSGPMLWTHVGVSGPAVLDASRHWHRAELDHRQVEIRVNFCPGRQFEAVDNDLTNGTRVRPRSTIDSILAAWVPASISQQLRIHAGVAEHVMLAHLTRDDRRRIVHALTSLPLKVRGSRGFDVAEATAGGVPLTEVDAATMRSRVRRGLHLAGEILDVDGRLGGFNFQWAWASGAVAGRAVAAATLSRRR